MYNKFLFIALSMVFSLNVFSQQVEETFLLGKVTFSGLEKTDDEVVYRILLTKSGDKVSAEQLNIDAQQLQNFAGIAEASYQTDTIGQIVNVVYAVSEVRTLLPIFNFGGISGNVWYQFGFNDINWLGKGTQLTAYYQNSDRRHSGKIHYRVPQISGSKWGYSATISRWASQEPLFFENGVTVQYNYDFNNLGLTGIYRFDNHRTFEFGGSYFVENYEKLSNASQEILPGPEQLSQPKLLSRFNYSENYINHHTFFLKGLSWQALVQNVFNLDDNSGFNSLILQSRFYLIPNPKVNIALRTRFGISTNNDSPFAPFVVDSHVNLRGVGNRIDRGTAQFILNAEIRRTLTDRKKWATQAVLFTDLGTWRDPGGTLSDLVNSDQFRHFVGGGFRIIYKKIYGAVLRVDFGVDIYNSQENGLVIGFGQYF